MLPLHHGHHDGDDRTRTGDLPLDKRVLWPLSYAPESGAGGIRTHGLELMRLARTAAPLPRYEGLAGWSRTSGLRRPKPAGWPSPLQPVAVPPAGLEPAASGLRARRHLPLRPRGHELRRQGSNLRFAINSRASYRSTTPESSGRRGSRTPKALRPTRFRDGIPRRWQSFQGGPGRSRTCTAPIKSRQLCRLSYGADECGRQDSNLRRVAFQATALPG